VGTSGGRHLDGGINRLSRYETSGGRPFTGRLVAPIARWYVTTSRRTRRWNLTTSSTPDPGYAGASDPYGRLEVPGRVKWPDPVHNERRTDISSAHPRDPAAAIPPNFVRRTLRDGRTPVRGIVSRVSATPHLLYLDIRFMIHSSGGLNGCPE
jgi:hypothetical protein